MANRKTKKRRRRTGGGPSGGSPSPRPEAGPKKTEASGAKRRRGRWDDGKARPRGARAPRGRGATRRIGGIPRWAVALAVVFVGLLFVQLYHRGSPKTGPTFASPSSSIDPTALPGVRTGPAPWSAGANQLPARVKAAGLPLTSGTALHIHAHLDVQVDGKPMTVPADIGIDQQAGFLAPLHTHGDDGIIHVESPVKRTFTLGEFFDVWGVRLSSTCLGGYCDQGDRTLRVYVDGKLATGDVANLVIFAHEEFFVAFGTPSELPSPIPASHGFSLFE